MKKKQISDALKRLDWLYAQGNISETLFLQSHREIRSLGLKVISKPGEQALRWLSVNPADLFATGGGDVSANPADLFVTGSGAISIEREEERSKMQESSAKAFLNRGKILSLGECLADRYLILACLGVGGMGQVYLAYDAEREKELALKCMHWSEETSSVERRLRRELELNEQLTHSGIVRTYSLERDRERQLLFFTMEFVAGRDLRSSLEQKDGCLLWSLSKRLGLLEKLALCIDYAHEQGVIHRDLHPANILLTEADQPKILDFGIASSSRTLLQSSEISGFGTAYYMSPEQLRGETVSTLSDLYSLGVVGFQLLSGYLPQPGIPGISFVCPELPKTFDPVFARILHWRPELRYPSASDFVVALQQEGRTNEANSLSKPSLFSTQKEADNQKSQSQFLSLCELALLDDELSSQKLQLLCVKAEGLGLSQHQARILLQSQLKKQGHAPLNGGLPWPEKASHSEALESPETRLIQSVLNKLLEKQLEQIDVLHQKEETEQKGDLIAFPSLGISAWDLLKKRIDSKRPEWLSLKRKRDAPKLRNWPLESAFSEDKCWPSLSIKVDEKQILLSRTGRPLLPLIKISSGSFWMGASLNDPSAAKSEKDGREVMLHSFWISCIPVTNLIWSVFVEESHYSPKESDSSYYLRHWEDGVCSKKLWHHPVTWVSYLDTWAFCDFYGLSLPSEAQWEKAARGSDGGLFPWGKQEPDRTLCNFGQEKNGTTKIDLYSDGCSPYGLYDCAGNISEWCADGWNAHLLKRSKESIPMKLATQTDRISIRGGNYTSVSRLLRTSARQGISATQSFAHVGFRPVLDKRS